MAGNGINLFAISSLPENVVRFIFLIHQAVINYAVVCVWQVCGPDTR